MTVPSDIEALLYPVEDDMGEHELQTLILEVLRPLVEALLRARGEKAHVGSDQFFYWRRWQPQKCLAPDLYVLFGVPQEQVIASWKVWETGIVPRFALEVVTDDRTKDYQRNLQAYDELGVEELIVFDPFEGRNRVLFQVFRRSDEPEHGRGRALSLELRTDADRVHSPTLDAWFVRVGEGGATRLRVGLGDGGAELLPTDAELAETERERVQAERERAELAEARAEALEAQLRALDGRDKE